MEKDMMKTIFDNQNKKAFIPFLTAGDPDGDSTVNFILEMEKAGADMIVIGIPFSDPTAEAPVIQEANIRALQNGMTTDGVFEVVGKVRQVSKVPLVLKTYANPVFHYGYERFFAKCEELGVCAIMVPDIPFEERQELEEPANAHGVAVISTITPASKERIQKLASGARGFLCVQGVGEALTENVRTSEKEKAVSSILESIRNVTDIPCVIELGSCVAEPTEEMISADGIVAGSTIVEMIAEHGRDASAHLAEYVRAMKAVMLA